MENAERVAFDARVALLALLAFLILGSYEIARPATESLFLSRHAYTELPLVWAWVAGACVATVAIYNRVAARLPLHRLMAACALFSAAALGATRAGYDAGLPGATYALYVWKDVYVVVMVEVFWTYANATFQTGQARWVYGLFLAAGSTGAIAGARTLRALTSVYGTADALWVVAPIMIAVAGLALVLGRTVVATRKPPPLKPGLQDGVKLLLQSRYLGLLLLLILTVQIVITLVDYRFNAIVSATYPQEDARTAAISGVYEIIGWGALAMQLLTGPILKLVGVAGGLVAAPVIALAATLALVFAPIFLIAAGAKVAGKVLDYSLFRAAKEMLYIPLPYAEKTQGKAFVDMLTYRVAKGGVALLLKGLLAAGLAAALGVATVAVAALWLGLTGAIVRRYRATPSAPEA